METVLSNAANYGIFCLLFTALLIYILKKFDKEKDESRKREEKLNEAITKNQEIIIKNQEIIRELTEKFEVLKNIQDDINEIKIVIKK